MTAARAKEAPDIALELANISKEFGKVVALDGASLRIRRGSIHALLGENGAGKTTLMRIAFGLISPDCGTIRVNGDAVVFRSPADAIASRIGMVHQQFSLVPEMTVAENIALGGRGKYNKKVVADHVRSTAMRLGMTIDPSVKVKNLNASERQKLEIVRTFAHDATTLILDEPTAVLTTGDVGDLFAQLRTFADSGGSVVLITHKLQDALAHADEVTVLRKGRCVLNSPMNSATEEILADAMLGESRSLENSTRRRTDGSQAAVVQLQDVSAQNEHGTKMLENVTLELEAGEIVGVAALDGAARPLLRIIAGRTSPSAGRITRTGTTGFVPEDRLHEALIPDFSLTENIALHELRNRRGSMDWRSLRSLTARVIELFDVKAKDVDTRISDLSGGNQQKLVLGRELSSDPQILVLENPTQGLDVRAASAIHAKMRTARDAGTCVLIYSTDLDELAMISDRVFVVTESAITPVAPDREAIGRRLLARAD